MPSVTHKKVDIKENIQDPAQHHGVTTNAAMTAEEFKRKLDTQE